MVAHQTSREEELIRGGEKRDERREERRKQSIRGEKRDAPLFGELCDGGLACGQLVLPMYEL
jgi:hypothetical protein